MNKLVGNLSLLALLGLGLLLLLGLQNGSITLSLADLRLLVLALLDILDRGTNNGTAGLNSLVRPALADLLNLAFTVVTTEKGSPGDLTGVLTLGEKRSRFRGEETEDLRVATDEELTAAGVHTSTAECVDLKLHWVLKLGVRDE